MSKSVTGVARIQQLVREGRITPRDAALLLELRRRLAERRRLKEMLKRAAVGALTALFLILFVWGLLQ